MSNDKWYWLSPLPGGRVGYLIFLPGQPAIWIDEQFKQSFKIQMRVSSSVYQKKSVLIASLNKTSCALRLEDAWILSGVSYLENTPFTQRWEALLDFYSQDFKEDRKLSQGLDIQPATYSPLHDAKIWLAEDQKEIPAMMFAQGENAPRRLRVQFREFDKKENNKAIVPPFFYAAAPAPAPAASVKVAETGDSIARAVAHDEHPDTYNIWINGVKKGYAAVQDIELSRCLREATKDKKEVLVKVEWNEEFNMYQILSQV